MASGTKSVSELTRQLSRWRILTVVALAVGIVVGVALGGTLGTPMGLDTTEQGGGQLEPGTADSGQQGQPGEADQPGESGEQAPQMPDLARRSPDDPAAIGDPDAPVVMIEYADYRCPFCALFAHDTLPTIIDDYVTSGDVRFEWRDMPIFGDESFRAAVATRAAAEQGMYWEYHDTIYAHAPERGHPDLPDEKLIEFAEEAGVPDIDKFTADLDDPALHDIVQNDLDEAQSLGATGTPTFIIGETPLVGAQPLSEFTKVLDDELAKATE